MNVKNLHPSLLVRSTPRVGAKPFEFEGHSCVVIDPETKKEVAACTSRPAAEAAARLLICGIDPPEENALSKLERSISTAETGWI